MRKVLLVSRPLVTPWDEASKNFARDLALGAKSSEVTVLTDGSESFFQSPIKTLPIYTQPHLTKRQRLQLLKLFFHRNRFDIVHYLFTPTKLNSTMFRLVLRSKRTKSVQTIASLNSRSYTDRQLRQMLFADLIVTYSDFSRKRLISIGLKNVKKIYPGIDLDQYKPRRKNLSMAKQLGIKKSDFVILYPGEYVRLGATDLIVQSLSEIQAAIPNVKFVFGCRIKNDADAKKKSEVMKTIASKRLTEHVLYTDTITDMPSLYNLSDVVVFPVTTMQGKFDVPLAVVEAMACAKPTVVSDLDVLRELTSSRNSIVVKAGDRKAFVQSLVDMYENPESRKSIGSSARAFTEKWFDIRDVAHRYEKAYGELLKNEDKYD